MARRKYILHESPDDRLGDDFGQISYPKSSTNPYQIISTKVSTTTIMFLFSRYFSPQQDKYILSSDADNSIIDNKKKKTGKRRRRRKINQLDIHTYDGDIFNVIASTDILGSCCSQKQKQSQSLTSVERPAAVDGSFVVSLIDFFQFHNERFSSLITSVSFFSNGVMARKRSRHHSHYKQAKVRDILLLINI